MPVLGSTPYSVNGINKRGVFIPQGALDNWRAARDAVKAGTTTFPVEVAIFGDSTTYGSSNASYGGAALYSWVERLRADSIGAGFTDGGYGVFNYNDTYTGYVANGQGDAPTFAITGTSQLTNGLQQTGFNFRTTGDQVVITGTCRYFRLHYLTSAFGGKLTYSVDGGAATTVDTLRPLLQTLAYNVKSVIIDTGTVGSHAITVGQTGLGVIHAPVLNTAGSAVVQTGGTIPPGTYYYFVTATSAGGESLPISAGSATTSTAGNNQKVQVVVKTDYGFTGAKLYRATTNSSAAAQLVATVSGSFSVPGTIAVADDGSGTPGAAPPTSSTLGTYSGGTDAEFSVDLLRATGIVYHRDAVSGATSDSFWQAYGAFQQTQAPWSHKRVGLQSWADAGSCNGYPWGAPPGSDHSTRNCKLAILQIGTNDIGGNVIGDGTSTTALNKLAEAIMHHIRATRAAGADPVIVAPPYDVSVDPGNSSYTGRVLAMTLATCQATGTAFVNFQEALGSTNGFLAKNYSDGNAGGPHLGLPAYNAEADFLWNNVLSL